MALIPILAPPLPCGLHFPDDPFHHHAQRLPTSKRGGGFGSMVLRFVPVLHARKGMEKKLTCLMEQFVERFDGRATEKFFR